MATTRERKPWARPPVAMSFQVPMYSASGLRVSYLKVLERKQGAGYQVRTARGRRGRAFWAGASLVR